jgi:plasmid stability protein
MSVATLHVRNFPDQLYEALRARAERQGRSIGAEAIAIVAATLVARTDRERRVLQLIRTRRSRGRGGGLFTRFTTRARQVVVDAQNEARSLKHNYIGTEHLLLGLLLADEGIGRAILESLGVTHARVRDEVLRLIG